MVTIDTETKNRALHKMADALVVGQNKIFQANGLDLSEGKKNGLSLAMLDRLKLDEKRISDIATGLLRIADLPDPVGEVTSMKTRPNGIRVGRMRMPLGVIGIIYESRPNVTADTSALCLKSGNAVILRGGSEAIHSNKLISSMLMDSASEAGIPENTIQIIPVTDRTVVSDLLSMDRYIDLVIPRGGYELIRFVIENSTIPVIKHDKGVCHVYVHSDADINMAT
ncbi:MAG TPA: glutamate-5-semialdehyde dehydrogenase, partial [Nitrospinota bacterium]|nr:glutamate-5-semialdehyde dehydrogenase [Nitrospinota bacterium]